jgi:hypothetical protein
MASITAPIDYKVGQYKININKHNEADVQACIDSVEELALIQLFGVDFKDIVLQGVVDLVQIYEKLYNPFTFQDSCDRIWQSKGVKEMLLGFVYFEWFATHSVAVVLDGQRENESENSKSASSLKANNEKRYNDAVKTYRAIQAYINDNLDIYPEFKGQSKLLMNWF